MPIFCRWLPLLFVLGGGVGACNGQGSASDTSRFTADLEQLGQVVARSAGYPSDAVELTASRVKLEISILDAKLAAMDDTARSIAVTSLVTVVERQLTNYPELGALQTIRVAVIHPSPADAPAKEWHVEDVTEFRRGPSRRFSIHMT